MLDDGLEVDAAATAATREELRARVRSRPATNGSPERRAARACIRGHAMTASTAANERALSADFLIEVLGDLVALRA